MRNWAGFNKSVIRVTLIYGMMAAAMLLPFRGEAAEYEAVWPGKPMISPSDALKVSVDLPESWNASSPVVITWNITAEHSFLNSAALLEILNSAGKTIFSDEWHGNLAAGQNTFPMTWDASAAVPGDYSARLTLDYAADLPLFRAVIPLERVSSAALRESVRAVSERAEVLRQQMENDTEHPVTAARIRLRTIELARARFDEAIEREQWQRACELSRYLKGTLRSVAAQLSFSSDQEKGDHDGISPAEEAGWVGLSLDTASPDAAMQTLQTAGDLGLRHCLLAVDAFPEAAQDPFNPERVAAWLTPILDRADLLGIYLILQFDQNQVASWVGGQLPEAVAEGRANLAVDGLSEALKSRMRAVASVARPYFSRIAAVAVASCPEMKFDGEAVRNRFVEEIRKRYEDRQSLNQAWRAHLASFDEITIWGEYPEHDYHHKRAFKYEWQRFHQGLISERLKDLAVAARDAFPGIPVTVTQNDEVLDAEPLTRPCRPDLDAIFDWTAYISSLNAENTPYALDYPRLEAVPAAIRSTAPDKPLVNLGFDVNLHAFPVEERASVAQLLLLDTLLNDVTGVIIPVSAQSPEILEGAALAALDLRRFGPVFRAFRMAPVEVGVLFSESAKIFDEGEPHLRSARFAFEGTAFIGAKVGYVHEHKIAERGLPCLLALIMPETPALQNAAFEALAAYLDGGGAVARPGTPIPYDERGHSRADVLLNTGNTVYVRGLNLPTEYLHAMDALQTRGALPRFPRPVNAYGYPLEGVKSRFVRAENRSWFFVVNMRPEPVLCSLDGGQQSGTDVLTGTSVDFPRVLDPLRPMLVRLDESKVIPQN